MSPRAADFQRIRRERREQRAVSERTPQDVLRELARLQEPGIGGWSSKDWRAFIRACDTADFAALSKAIAEAPDSHQSAWLIERGQPEKQVPTVWWADRKRWGLMYMDDWTADAYKAFRFESQEAAEEVIAAKFTPPASRGAPTARAVEHGFIAVPDTLSEKPGLDVERLRLAALNVARAWMEERRRNHYTSEPIPLAELRAVLGSTDSEGR